MPVYLNGGKNHQEKTDSKQKKKYFKKKRRDKKIGLYFGGNKSRHFAGAQQTKTSYA